MKHISVSRLFYNSPYYIVKRRECYRRAIYGPEEGEILFIRHSQVALDNVGICSQMVTYIVYFRVNSRSLNDPPVAFNVFLKYNLENYKIILRQTDVWTGSVPFSTDVTGTF